MNVNLKPRINTNNKTFKDYFALLAALRDTNQNATTYYIWQFMDEQERAAYGDNPPNAEAFGAEYFNGLFELPDEDTVQILRNVVDAVRNRINAGVHKDVGVKLLGVKWNWKRRVEFEESVRELNYHKTVEMLREVCSFPTSGEMTFDEGAQALALVSERLKAIMNAKN